MNKWTTRLDQLRALLADGKSASEAAAVLGVTRNAVISVAKRNGIPFLRRQGQSRPAAPLKPAVRRLRLPRAVSPPIAPAPPARLASQPCSLMELTNARCRWPYGEPGQPDFHFCGAPEADMREGRPYCRYHQDEATRS